MGASDLLDTPLLADESTRSTPSLAAATVFRHRPLRPVTAGKDIIDEQRNDARHRQVGA